MINMLLTSTEDDEVDMWMGKISRYRELLNAHSQNFDFTRLASIRMDILLQRGTSVLEREDGLSKRPSYAKSDKPSSSNDTLENPQSMNLMSNTEGVGVSMAFEDTIGFDWGLDLVPLLGSVDYDYNIEGFAGFSN